MERSVGAVSSLVVVVCFIFTLNAAVYAIDEEAYALLDFKKGIEDPNNTLNNWDPDNLSHCDWFHVTYNSDNSVTRVDLAKQGISGPLSPELGNLKNLLFLELYENHLNGTIPEEFGNLTNLMNLDLYDNQLTGSIPGTLVKLLNLRFIRLNNNKLSGDVPAEWRDARKIWANIAEMDFTGNTGLRGPCTQQPCKWNI